MTHVPEISLDTICLSMFPSSLLTRLFLGAYGGSLRAARGWFLLFERVKVDAFSLELVYLHFR